MSIIDGHTCIGDDGGTPNRKCEACANEARPKERQMFADIVNGRCVKEPIHDPWLSVPGGVGGTDEDHDHE